MILHIVPDDKFIDMAYNMFEKASPNNKWCTFALHFGALLDCT